jgi:hypothetical protein
MGNAAASGNAVVEMRQALAQRILEVTNTPGEHATAIPELWLYHRMRHKEPNQRLMRLKVFSELLALAKVMSTSFSSLDTRLLGPSPIMLPHCIGAHRERSHSLLCVCADGAPPTPVIAKLDRLARNVHFISGLDGFRLPEPLRLTSTESTGKQTPNWHWPSGGALLFGGEDLRW